MFLKRNTRRKNAGYFFKYSPGKMMRFFEVPHILPLKFNLRRHVVTVHLGQPGGKRQVKHKKQKKKFPHVSQHFVQRKLQGT